MPFNTAPVQNFIGNGLTFPINLTNGKPVLDSGFPLIEASIRNIISFTLGKRFMLGEFGSVLDELLEEPNDEILQNLVNTYIIDAVLKWEARVKQIQAQVTQVFDTGGLQISITYQVINSSSPQNFVFPFYTVIPD